jgi:hypothetical protein
VLKGLALTDRLVNSPPDSLTSGDVVHVAGPAAPASAERRAKSAEEAEAVGPEPKQH